MSIVVTLDVSAFTNRLDFAAREILNGLRSAVDRSARAARKAALVAAAEDEGAGMAYAKADQPTVRGSTQTSLSATWTVKPKFISALRTSGATLERGRGLHMSTFRTTGGGSDPLDAPKAFGFSGRNANVLAFRRTKWGPGTHRGKGDIKAISAEITKTAIGQEGAAPRLVWEKTASTTLATLATAALQAALDGAKPSTDGGRDD